jgi:hypothetical protein
MSDEPQLTQAPCNECCQSTDHLVLHTRTIARDLLDDPELLHETVDQMLECCGCHSITLKHSAGFTKNDKPDIHYFPPPLSRRKPKWAWPGGDIPDKIILLLEEIYQALHADSRRLATMGTRALLDIVMVDKIGDKGTFEKKLTALQDAGLLSASQRTHLAAVLGAGHAASHRGHCPAPHELNQVMDIVEKTIADLYVHPNTAQQLRQSVPPRKPASK